RDAKESQNGWATEEATDIQDMGEFDFEANHKLFDKRQVFDELRQGDTTAGEERLVGHNKITRPGTYGGKNLHPTENVLSPKVTAEDVSSDADTEMNFQTGRSSSRHSVTKRKPSRQNTAILTNPLSASMTSDRGLSRSVTSLSRSGKLPPSAAGAMPVLDRVHSPLSIGSGPTKANGKKSKPPATQAPPAQGPLFSLTSSQKPCPVLHPNALATLEDATVARFGLTHDAITETAARCIAELAYDMITGSSPSRRNSSHAAPRGSVSKLTPLTSSTPSHPVIVILAGDHPTSARAVAAARQLASRGCKIILAEAPPEVTGTQDEQLAKQLAMLKKLARSGATIKRGPWRNVSKSIKSLPGPPSLIIDALLAGATYLPSNTDEDDPIRLMIDWATRSRASVLSIGCPSGISGIDGTATVVEGEPLAVRADQVLALGAPMKGLLDAKGLGERWDVSVADVGINIALMREDAVGFGGEWVVGVGFEEG
ncbi:enhancer of mRNA decapping, partial [Oleoguttula sp. CCFEE 5521]